MALLLAVLTTAVRADVVPFTESYNAESTTDGWTSSVEGRFTPIIYNEADLQQGASDNYFLSVNQSELSNNGCLVTGTVLSGKAAAGDDFTLEFDMRLCNSNNNVNSQFPVSLQIKDADNDKDILSLSTPAKYVQTWNVNGTDLQVTLPGYGGQTISALTWCHYKISRSSGLTYLTITDNSTQEPILERTLIGGSSETGGLGNIVFTTKRYRSNFAIDNIVVRQLQESDVPSVEMSSYTIKYHNESGDEIAADIVTPYIVGGEATANDGQLAPIYYNDKKYLYKEGNSTITLVGDAAQNVITLVYREAQKCSYTIMGEYGDKEKVLHEGTGYEGDVVTYNYPEYILDGTTLYFKQTKTTNPHFGGTILLNEANITEYVYYTDGEASNVVYYKEAEQMDGFTPLATNNADIRCSDGMGGVIDGDEPVVLTTLPAGTYTIHGQIWGTAGYTATITAGDKTVWELTSVGWIIDATSDIFTLDEETTLYIKDSGDMDGMKMLDLIYIQEAKPQYVAEFNRVEGTLTFKKGTLSLGAATTWDAENTGSEPGWYSQRTNVKTVIFDESFADARPTSCAQWFKGATTLTTITGLEYLNTSEVTSMAEMFRNTQQLTTLDLRTFNTENVTDMNYMFYNDYRLTSLNVSSFNTANVEDMSFMFGYCSALPELDVSNLNTSKVTGMVYMFGGCSSLASLDVSKFNTSYVTNMMYMFGGCNSLTSLDVSNFNTSKVTNMGGMFNSCNSLTSLDICNFNTSNVTEMGYMFYYCSSLKTISVGEEWNTSAVTSSEGMFSNCTALVGGAGTTYDAEQTDAKYARIDGGADAPGYFTAKNVTPKDNVTLTAKSYSRQYGEENPAFEYDVTEGTITDGAPELATEATATSPVGTYDIVISKGSVTNNEVSLVNGTLTITKAPLTISCGDYTIMQGEVLPEFALEYNGWKNDETEDVLTTKPTVACEASKDSEPGTYDIIVSGAEAENYEISYVAGTLTIEAKPIVIEPVEVETEMKTETLSGQDLSNNVVNDVYYNVGSDSYDASDKSIVISQPTNMAQIADKQPGSKDVKENFNGMILKVAKGKGLITVNVKTSGNAQLVVQVGNGTPMLASKTEKGDVVFRYDVEEDTYVYIYAIIGSSAAKGYGLSAADTESSVRIYSITVSPGATGIRSIGASEKNNAVIYDLQGRRVENPAKGIYIMDGRKVSVK